MNPLPFVENIETSKHFYTAVLGLTVAEDHGNFVKFDGGFAIHDGESLFKTVFGTQDGSAKPYGRRNLVLYFEDAELDPAFARISPSVHLIHPIRQEPWGQRVFRFYDPDQHIIELGEPQ